MLRPIDKHNVVKILKGLNPNRAKRAKKEVLKKCYKVMRKTFSAYSWKGVISEMEKYSGISASTLMKIMYCRKKKIAKSTKMCYK